MAALAVLGGRALVAADKATVQVPGGLAMAEFKATRTGRFATARPRADEGDRGQPDHDRGLQGRHSGQRQAVPEGATWSRSSGPRRRTGGAVRRQDTDTLNDVLFMTKDSKRFAASAGWGYGRFNHDAASGSFTPEGSGSACGMPVI